MSRASEYAKAINKAPTFHVDEDTETTPAYVSINGKLQVFNWTYTPAEALALAAWIVETFGDNPSKVAGEKSVEPDISSKEKVTITRAQLDRAGIQLGCSTTLVKEFARELGFGEGEG